MNEHILDEFIISEDKSKLNAIRALAIIVLSISLFLPHTFLPLVYLRMFLGNIITNCIRY
jgi:hypothetical protein